MRQSIRASVLAFIGMTAAVFPQGAPVADDIDQRVRVLERKLELAEEQKAANEKATATATAGADGFTLKSAKGDFQLKLKALIQTDGRFFSGDEQKPIADTLVVRRARPILEGNLGKLVEFRLMPDFGSGTTTLLDAYFGLRFGSSFALRLGKGKVPVGLEQLLNDQDLPFVERGAPAALAPVRDVGILAVGEPFGGRIVYALGVFNGVPDNQSGDLDSGDDKDWAARLFFRPFQKPADQAPPKVGLGFGVGASVGRQAGSATSPSLASYKTPGAQTFFSYRGDTTTAGTTIADGDRVRLAPQAWFYSGPVLLFAEWTESRQEVARDVVRADLAHRAWQIAGSWALTGEPVTERGVVPRHPFDPAGGGHGAFLVSLRYGVVEIDDAAFPDFADPAKSARRAVNAGASFGWILSRNVRTILDYQQTSFDGGAAAGADRETERALLVRFQLAF